MFETFEQNFSQNKEEKELVKFLPGEVFDHILQLREAISEDIIGINSVYKMPDGTLAGVARVKKRHFPNNPKHAPFKGDTLIEEIAGKKVMYADYIESYPDGTLTGEIVFTGGEQWYPFLWNESKEILF